MAVESFIVLKFLVFMEFEGLSKLANTSNRSAIANSHTLQFTIAHTKSSISLLCVAWQRIPTVSSASMFGSLPAGYHLTTGLQLATSGYD
jgi:hypothetical protein